MKFQPIEAFRNPVTRPRAIVWLLTLITFVCFFVPVAVFATTSYWFCAEICHAVQDDSINSYLNSSHSNVACVACHYKPGKSPVALIESKLGAAISELPPTLMGTFHIPLNPWSALAMNGYEMGSKNCLSCHVGGDRFVTPAEGIIMDHDAHADRDIACTVCHNRVGHNEDGIELVLSDPQSGEPAFPHLDFMKMDACYRCHRLEDDGLAAYPTPFKKASGECPVCHTADFDLVPPSHKVPNFLTDVHGPLAVEEDQRVRDVKPIVDDYFAYKYEKYGGPKDDAESQAVKDVPNGALINTCYTCHEQRFCNDCHGGVEMPHPVGFLQNHKAEADAHMAACEFCHGGAEACSICHHSPPNVSEYEFDPTKSFLDQHWVPSQGAGAAQCFNCHEPTFCAICHVRGSSN